MSVVVIAMSGVIIAMSGVVIGTSVVTVSVSGARGNVLNKEHDDRRNV